MKIHSIEITNYRSYVGKQIIPFKIADKKNVTVILGVNGAGKTNILNAINWCFYGDEPHSSIHAEKKPILNQSALYTAKEGSNIECKVKIILGDKKPEYQIERKIMFQKRDGKLNQIDQDFKVHFITDGGWKLGGDPTYMVNNVLLPKKIRDYFLFNGERLDDFFKSGNENLIQESVLNVAQIGLIEKAQKHLFDIKNNLDREIAAIAPNTKDILGRIENYRNSIKQMESEKEQNETEKRKALNQIGDIKKILREHPVALIRELQKRNDKLENEIESINEELKQVKEENEDRILYDAPFILSKEAISKAIDLINKEFEEHRLPPIEEEIFVRSLLKRKQCICGVKFSEHPECKETLEKILKSIPKNAKEIGRKITDQAYDTKYTLESIRKKIKSFFDEGVDFNERIKKLKTDLENKNKEIRENREKMGKHDIEEIESLQDNQETLEETLQDVNLKIKDLEKGIERLNELIKIEEGEFKKESRKEERGKDITSKSNFCEKCLNSLDEIKKQLITEIRETIKKRTKEYFFNLIWKKKSYNDIKIDENYKISVIDNYGVSCLGSLSAGERQVLALSFMAALYEVTGFDMPIIIDTPLGRISGKPRDNIAKSLPEYLKDVQLTLLILDTEYTDSVRNFISRRVGNQYHLDFDDEKSETMVKKYASK